MPLSWKLLVQGAVLLVIAVALLSTCDAAVDRTVSDSEFIESMQQTDAVFDELLQIGIFEFGPPDQQSREGLYCAGLGGPTGADRLHVYASWDIHGEQLRSTLSLVDELRYVLDSAPKSRISSKRRRVSRSTRPVDPVQVPVISPVTGSGGDAVSVQPVAVAIPA